MSSTRSFPRQQLAADFRSFLRRNRKMSALLALGDVLLTSAASAALILAWNHGSVLWYVLGALHMFMLGALVTGIIASFLVNTKTAIWNLRGAWGEDNTGEVLKAATRRKTIWGFVQGVVVMGGDVDHLVVTRAGGVIAIDSKWRNEVNAEILDKDAASARAAARRAESIMRSEHVGTLKREARARHRDEGPSYSVLPVVVIWGAERHRMPERHRRGGVEFIAGEKLRPWLEGRDGQPVDKAAARDLLERLSAFRDR